MKEIAIYIHIPFCHSKCYYCDFNSFINKLDTVEMYIKYLKKEIDIYSELIKDYTVKTIFIGGGTPSLLDGKYINEILDYLYKNLNCKDINEITIEANPKTLDREKLNTYRQSGINRISLGVQTLNDNLLKSIGRIHTSKDFFQTYETVRKAGFDNVNLDIMFNLPNQSLDDVDKTLREVIKLQAEHISFYSLKVEERTPFYSLYDNNKLELPNEDIEREMYYKGIELLTQSNYKHYEISNFSKPGFECQHNLFYWNVKPYVGLGLSAHSNIEGKRYGNLGSFNKYFDCIDTGKLPIEETDSINIEMEMAEYLILGLRLIDGIKDSNFKRRFGISIFELYDKKLQDLASKGLLEIQSGEGIVKLTTRGVDISNIVFMELLP